MLTVLEGQLAQGTRADPERARIKLADDAEAWITQRPGRRVEHLRARLVIVLGSLHNRGYAAILPIHHQMIDRFLRPPGPDPCPRLCLLCE